MYLKGYVRQIPYDDFLRRKGLPEEEVQKHLDYLLEFLNLINQNNMLIIASERYIDSLEGYGIGIRLIPTKNEKLRLVGYIFR